MKNDNDHSNDCNGSTDNPPSDRSQSLERVARYLDGQKLPLSAEEMLLASRMELDAHTVGRELEALDAGEQAAARLAIAAARRRLGAKLAAPRVSIFRAFVVAAAAAVLIFAMILWPSIHRPGGPATPPTGEGNSLAAVANEIDPSDSGKLDLIAAMAMDKDELDQAIVQTNPEQVVEAHLSN